MKKDENKFIPIPFTIKKVNKNTSDVHTVEITPNDKTKLSFKPGQFNMLYIFGIGEIPISISGDEKNQNSFFHTTKSFGAVSHKLNKLKSNISIGVRGPFGTAWPLDKAIKKDVILVAGGIGIAPLRPVIYHIINHRKKFGEVTLLFGAKAPQDIIYKNELSKWSSMIKVIIAVGSADNKWKGNVGAVTKFISQAKFNPKNSISMLCGPEIMMRFAIRELIKPGMKEEDIYLSMERNMKCAVGFCGHCQYGPEFICKDGPVFSYKKIKNIFGVKEI